MRVAANLVEQILVAAATEVSERHHETEKSRSSDYGRLVEAFKRAAELRDRPLRCVALRGSKSHIEQVVIVTNIERGEAGHLYALCLVPYTDAQMLHRKTFKYETYIKAEDDHDKIIATIRHDSGIPPRFHEQWIRTDRLRHEGYAVK